MPITDMYGDLAPWFHLLTAPEEYADDAAFILTALRQVADGPVATLLELGSGGGNTASHLKRDLRVTLTDVSPQMPDHIRDTFAEGTDHGGHDGPGLAVGRPDRALRYLEWTTDPDPDDSTYQVDYAMLVREKDGSVEVHRDRHIEGLFPRQTWLDLLASVGFEAPAMVEAESLIGFVGKRPAD